MAKSSLSGEWASGRSSHGIEVARARNRPVDADYYPGTSGIIHEPAFFEALSAKTETGRYGIAGWSSPNSPAGADYTEISGWLSFDFAFTWASPPISPKRPPR